MAPDREAQFICSLAVAASEGFLGGRIDAGALGKEADRVACQVLTVSSASADVPDALRLLVVTMRRTSIATGARQEHWADVMAALARLVRHEAAVLK